MMGRRAGVGVDDGVDVDAESMDEVVLIVLVVERDGELERVW